MGRARDRGPEILVLAGFVVASAVTAWTLLARGARDDDVPEPPVADRSTEPDPSPSDAGALAPAPASGARPGGLVAGPAAPDVRLAGPGLPPGATLRTAPQRSIVVHGVVFGPGGAPVGGCLVRLDTGRDGGAEGLPVSGSLSPSSVDGTFTVAATVAAVDGAGRRWTVVALPPAGLAPRDRLLPGRSAPFSCDRDDGRVAQDVHVTLRRGARFDVTLTDRLGGVVTEARVRVRRDGPVSGPPPDAGPADDDGTFRLGGLEPGPCTLVVSSRLFADVLVPAQAVADRVEFVRVAVEPRPRVRGVVVDRGGRPVAGAIVEVDAPERPDADAPWGPVAEARADEAGRFDVPMLPDGPLRVRAHARGLDTPGEGVAASGDARDLRVEVLALGRARLALVASDGRPLEGVSVTVTVGPVDGSREPVRDDAVVTGGVVVVEGLRGDDEQVVVDALGYAPLVRTVRAAPGEEVDLGRATLSAGRRLEGVVVDDAGRAVAHVLLVAAGGRFSAWSDDAGRFVLDRLPDGDVDLVARAPDALPTDVHVPAAATGLLRVVVARGGRLRGVLEGPDGRPAGGARLVVRPADGDPDADGYAFRTDEDGSFELRLPPGRYVVVASDGGEDEPLARVEVRGPDDAPLALRRAR